MANFTPDFKPYSGQGKFRYWVQMVLPTIYDDSLSYMELLNKVVYIMNLAIEDVDAVEENVAALLTAFEELQQYTNDYFDNLDVQEEINNKLDAMVDSGEFSVILQPLLDDYVAALEDLNNEIATLSARMDTFTNLPEGSTSGDAELQDIRVAYNGQIFNSAGTSVREQVKTLWGAADKLSVELYKSGTVITGELIANGVYNYVQNLIVNAPTARLRKYIVNDDAIAYFVTSQVYANNTEYPIVSYFQLW